MNEKDLERISDIDRLREKEQAIVYDNNAFIEFVEKLESLVIYSTPGQGKTSLLTFLASVLSQTNKYANFPCHLPWMDISQIDFGFGFFLLFFLRKEVSLLMMLYEEELHRKPWIIEISI